MSPSRQPSHVALVPHGLPERLPLLSQTVIAVGAALLLFCLASIFRYEIVPATPILGAMRLDRWTGTVVFCPVPYGTGHNTLDCTAK